MKTFIRSRLFLWLVICVLMLGGTAVCLISAASLSRSQPSQLSAERWKGSGDVEFAKVSAFLPVDATISYKDIISFRYDMLKKLNEAGYKADEKNTVFRDAWSTSDTLSVIGSRKSVDIETIAAGGYFFDLHPMNFVYGSGFSEDDVMQDRIVLSREAAWRLYGAVDVVGMDVTIGEYHFVVSGVVELEDDSFSETVHANAPMLFMSYDAFKEIKQAECVSCYEIIYPEQVEGYALNAVKDKFKFDGVMLVQNTGRFSKTQSLKRVSSISSRSVVTGGYSLPYWENAARCAEDRCTTLYLLAYLLLILPAITAAVFLVKLIIIGKEKLEDDILPEVSEKAEETLRRIERRRWEKQHPGQQ